jgi:nitrite reductase (NADH) small subunit
MPFFKVGRVEEIPPGRTRYVHAGGIPILLVNHEGSIYALHGLCAHQGNPLQGAALWGRLISCPFHNFQYDVETGRNFYPANVYPDDMLHLRKQLRPLKTYEVQVHGNEIWVNIP